MKDSRKETLRSRHAELETKISDELKSAMPDATLVRELKKKKLSIKDKLHL